MRRDARANARVAERPNTREGPSRASESLLERWRTSVDAPQKGGHEDDRLPMTDNDAFISAIHVVGVQKHAARGLGNELERREKRTLLWR